MHMKTKTKIIISSIILLFQILSGLFWNTYAIAGFVMPYDIHYRTVKLRILFASIGLLMLLTWAFITGFAVRMLWKIITAKQLGKSTYSESAQRYIRLWTALIFAGLAMLILAVYLFNIVDITNCIMIKIESLYYSIKLRFVNKEPNRHVYNAFYGMHLRFKDLLNYIVKRGHPVYTVFFAIRWVFIFAGPALTLFSFLRLHFWKKAESDVKRSRKIVSALISCGIVIAVFVVLDLATRVITPYTYINVTERGGIAGKYESYSIQQDGFDFVFTSSKGHPQVEHTCKVPGLVYGIISTKICSKRYEYSEEHGINMDGVYDKLTITIELTDRFDVYNCISSDYYRFGSTYSGPFGIYDSSYGIYGYQSDMYYLNRIYGGEEW